MKILKVRINRYILFITLFSIASSLSASPKKDIKFTGWLDIEYRGDNKSKNKTYFDASHLYLIAEADFEKDFSCFIEIQLEHLPNTKTNQGNLNIGRLYVQKMFSPKIGLRFGKFSTPFGYWTPYHWQVLVETATVPIHESNGYIPNKSVGAELFGSIFVKEQEFEWKLFFSNGSEVDGTNKPEDHTFGGGGDLRFVSAEEISFVGISYYNQQNPKYEGRVENSIVGYGGTSFGLFDVRGEYIYQTRSLGKKSTFYHDVETFYLSGQLNVSDDVAIGSRYDYGDDERMKIRNHHSMTSLFLNWTPIPELIGKLEYDFHRNDLPNHPGRDSWVLYVGIIF